MPLLPSILKNRPASAEPPAVVNTENSGAKNASAQQQISNSSTKNGTDENGVNKKHAHEKRKQKSPPKSPSDEKAKTSSQFPAANANSDDDRPSEKPHFDEGDVNIPKHKTETEYVEETRHRNVPVGGEESNFNAQKANNEQPIGRENEANEHLHRSASNSPKFHHRAGTDAREHEHKRARQTENNPKKV